MKLHLPELKIDWITKIRLKYVPFIKSNNDLIYFVIGDVSSFQRLFSDKWFLSLKIWYFAAVFYQIAIYVVAKHHKMVMAGLFPLWGSIWFYQFLLHTHVNGFSINTSLNYLSLAFAPYLLIALVNYFRPELRFRHKTLLFIGFCVLTLGIKNLLQTWF